jgi:hypothetical protein
MDNFIQEEKRVFVIGCTRSGTTLLQRILLGMEGSFSIPKTNFFGLASNMYECSSRTGPRLIKDNIKKKYNSIDAELLLNRISNKIDFEISVPNKWNGKIIEVSEIFNIVENFFKGNNTILIEATPSHVYHIKDILDIFPNAILVGIVRDPRDVYLSFSRMLKDKNKAARTLTEFCKMWNTAYYEMVNNKVEFVKYEDLIKNPLTAVNKLFDDDLPFIKKIPSGSSKYVTHLAKSGEIWKNNVFNPINQHNKNNYVGALEDKDIELINYLCSEVMIDLQYLPKNTKVSSSVIWYLVKDNTKWVITRFILHLKCLSKYVLREVYKGIK